MSPRPRRPEGNTIPAWVKAGVAVGASAILLVVALLLLGHGPGQHMPEETPSTSDPRPAGVGSER